MGTRTDTVLPLLPPTISTRMLVALAGADHSSSPVSRPISGLLAEEKWRAARMEASIRAEACDACEKSDRAGPGPR